MRVSICILLDLCGRSCILLMVLFSELEGKEDGCAQEAVHVTNFLQLLQKIIEIQAEVMIQ